MARLANRGEVVITRALDDVFAYLQDVEREREWQPTLVEAQALTPGPLRVGTRRRYVNVSLGRRVVTIYEVIDVQPPRRILYQSTPESTLWSRWGVTCESTANATRVVMQVEAETSGLLRLIPTAVLAAVSARELTTLLGRLKMCLEDRAPPRAPEDLGAR